MTTAIQMVLIALQAVFVKNLVFSGGFGMGEAMRIATKPKRFLLFACLLTGFCVFDAMVCSAIYIIFPVLDDIPMAYQLLINACVLLALFLLVVLAVTLVTRQRPDEKFLSTIGMAALNTLVFTLPILGRLSAYGLWEALAFGIGAGAAFLLALSVLKLGVERILANAQEIPHAFRGTPALFLYSALFSMAMAGLGGGGIF
ncbi:MAG: hypothetical protein FWG82_00950 [Oscillospiraceae bacterium]|nr:hypothetical protein [Oscillospiraceae bacterium]